MTHQQQRLSFLVVIDFECTCDAESDATYAHEIIEFPAVLLDLESKQVVSQFRSFVRPTEQPMLSRFCTELTGIQQHQVAVAPTLLNVLQMFERWLVSHELLVEIDDARDAAEEGAAHNMLVPLEIRDRLWAVATDGPWDMETFLFKQLTRLFDGDMERAMVYMSRLHLSTWLDIRSTFARFYELDRRKNIAAMLKHLGMSFVGHRHSGIDDALNLARVLVRLLEASCTLEINDCVFNVDRRQHYRSRVPIPPSIDGKRLPADWPHLYSMAACCIVPDSSSKRRQASKASKKKMTSATISTSGSSRRAPPDRE